MSPEEETERQRKWEKERDTLVIERLTTSPISVSNNYFILYGHNKDTYTEQKYNLSNFDVKNVNNVCWIVIEHNCYIVIAHLTLLFS